MVRCANNFESTTRIHVSHIRIIFHDPFWFFDPMFISRKREIYRLSLSHSFRFANSYHWCSLLFYLFLHTYHYNTQQHTLCTYISYRGITTITCAHMQTNKQYATAIEFSLTSVPKETKTIILYSFDRIDGSLSIQHVNR